MNTSTAIVTCTNPSCKAPNSIDRHFCQKCQTYVPKRYLWAIGQSISANSKGHSISDRYLVIDSNILLDTQPGLMPTTTEDIPPFISPYLRLSGYQPQMPKVYGLVESKGGGAIWLLEDAPIYSQGAATQLTGRLMPKLVDVWGDKNITPLRQLNWLTQIVELWQPMVMEKVASTLLSPECLRLEGSLIRILELVPDRQGAPTLADLGKFWQQFLPSMQPAAAEFWQLLSQQLASGQYTSSEQVVDVLSSAMNSCSGSYDRLYQIATYSDKGPTRSRNEDACYPPSGSFLRSVTGKDLGLTIVCDGIGGHEGGNVASNMAIEVIREETERFLTNPASWEPKTVSNQLETYVRNANDRISQRNDSEQRYSRQRMGTTVVMAVNHGHQVFLAHVGDSRVYRISKTGCHQVTLDDDLAAREVRLGYALYREALQHASSGSLIQALGMGGSYNLHPSVQKFVIDEDCIFLLCSDGLSDRDRVDQFWEVLVMPVLEGKKDLATLAKELLDLGNSRNGHDNVTIGLLYCQAKFNNGAQSPIPPPPVAVVLPNNGRTTNQPTRIQFPGDATFLQPSQTNISAVSLPSASAPHVSSKPNLWRWGWLIPVALGTIGLAAGTIAYIFFPQYFPTNLNSNPNPSPTPSAIDSVPEILPGQFYQTKGQISGKSRARADVALEDGQLLKIESTEPNSEALLARLCSAVPANKDIKDIQEDRKSQKSIPDLIYVQASDLRAGAVRITEVDGKNVGECYFYNRYISPTTKSDAKP